MITENLSTLKIHKLTQEQYERELDAGRIDPNALYLTPDESMDLSEYATKEDLNEKSDLGHTHIISESNLDSALVEKVNSAAEGNHSHSNKEVLDEITSEKVSAWDSSLDEAKEYIDSEIAEKIGDKTVSAQISDAISGKSDADHKHTAAEVGADPTGSAASALTDSKSYTDTKIANLINGAPTTLDTLGEIAAAMEENQDVVEALDAAMGTKASTSDLISHTDNKSNPHGVTAAQVGADVSGSAASALASAKSYTNTQMSELVGDKKVSEQISTAIADKANSIHDHEIDDVNGLTEVLSGKQVIGDYATKAEAKSYADAKDSAITAAQSTADKAVVANSSITGGTHTKITYDSKGLVTGGTSLSASDIPTLAISKVSGLQSALDAKQDNLVFNTTYNASTNKVATMSDVKAVSNLVGDTKVSEQINSAIVNKSDTGHTHDNRYYTESEVDTKLSGKSDSGHTHSAYVNQNAFSNVVVGSTTIAADSATDTLTMTAGDNITLTPDATNDKITIAAKDTTYSAATTSAAGLMSATDKSKLDGIATGANKTTVDSALSSSSTNPVQNKVVNAAISNLNTLVGDTSVSTQISNAIASKSDTSHTHDDRYYTESEINTKLNAKSDTSHKHDSDYAAKSHGNHVPTTETANNAKFLRNDNTWQTVTPANIGAAASSHGTHVSYSTTTPVMDGTASVGSASTVARSDHKHPTDTSRAAASDLTALQALVGDTKVSTQISDAIASKSDTGHTHSSYVNQNAFSNVTVGSTTIAADSTTDTLTLVAGSNVTITPDATNDKITIAATDTVYTHPSYTARTGVPTANQTPAFGGTFSVSQPVSDATGHITAVNSRTITIPNATATTSAAGLMSTSDKSKLDGIASGANKTTVDSALSSTSTNPVQNKVVNTAISNLNTKVTDVVYAGESSDTAAEVINADTLGGVPASGYALDTDITNLQNQISSKAPEGYGLGHGQGKTLSSLEEINSTIENGWYNIDLATTIIGGHNISNGELFVVSRSNNHGYQILRNIGFDGLLMRVRRGGTWKEWEWIDPPMEIGIEYRTTKRYGNYSVYTKLISCGNITTGRNVIAHNLSCEIIDYAGSCDKNALPYHDANTNGEATLAVTLNNIIINATSQFNGKRAYVQIWYVKG